MRFRRPRPLKVWWAKGGAEMRVPLQDQPYYVVLNRDSKRAMLVLLDQQGYVETPHDPNRQIGFTVPSNVPLVRGSNDVVAGDTCTLWHARLGAGDGALCVTDDGVLLKAEGFDDNHAGDLVATSVIYGPVSESEFAPPSGFRKLDIARPAAAGKR